MGNTISVNGKTPEAIVEEMKTKIKNAFPYHQPDSDLSLHNPTTKETKLYRVTLEGPDENMQVHIKEICVETPINSAMRCAIAVAMNFAEKPERNEWIGCIHFE